MASIRKLKESVFEANCELYRKNLVISTFGNVSGIDRERGIIAIKPSGVPYDKLTPENIVVVNLENKVVSKNLKPSSDTKTHLALYNHFPTIGGIAHTHSPFATVWAQAVLPIPCLGTTHADYIHGTIPCTRPLYDKEIQDDYEENTGNVIVECFRDLSPDDVQMVLVANHGPFTWGETPSMAVYNSAILEYIAQITLLTSILNPSVAPISKALQDKHYFRKHGKNASYGQDEI